MSRIPPPQRICILLCALSLLSGTALASTDVNNELQGVIRADRFDESTGTVRVVFDAQAASDLDVEGMRFVSTLGSWAVDQSGRQMSAGSRTTWQHDVPVRRQEIIRLDAIASFNSFRHGPGRKTYSGYFKLQGSNLVSVSAEDYHRWYIDSQAYRITGSQQIRTQQTPDSRATLSVHVISTEYESMDNFSSERSIGGAGVSILTRTGSSWILRAQGELEEDGTFHSSPWTQSFPCDVQIRIRLDGDNCTVENESGWIYQAEFEYTINSSSPGVISQAELMFVPSHGDVFYAAAAYGAVQDAWKFFYDETNEDVNPVDVIYPETWETAHPELGIWPYYSDNHIYIPANDSHRTTMLHEYGHHIQYREYGFIPYCDPGGDGSHNVSLATCPEFALTEGWAQFVSCVVDNRPDNLLRYDQNIETNTWYQRDGDHDDGCITEGSIASMLWDAYDGTSEQQDSMDMGINVLYNDIFEGEEPGNPVMLFEALVDELNNQSAVETVFGHYGCDICTELDDPQAPGLTSPANNATNQPLSGTLDWANVSDADGYQVQLSTACQTGTVYDTSGSAYSYSNLEPGTTYYWRVRARNICGTWGDFSGCRSFTTLTLNNPPAITSFEAQIPDPPYSHEAMYLTAYGVSDADGSVVSVEFYHDFGQIGVYETGIDELIDEGEETSPGTWQKQLMVDSYPEGTHHFIARARDDDSAWSDPHFGEATFYEIAPIIGVFTLVPNPVYRPDDLTMTASEVSDQDGDPYLTTFFLDTEVDGVFNPAETLGEHINAGESVFFITVSSTDLPPGLSEIWARAMDQRGVFSEPVVQILDVREAVPVIELPEFVGVDCLDGQLSPVQASFTISNSGGGVLEGEISADYPAYSFNPTHISIPGGQSQLVEATYTSSGCRDGSGEFDENRDTITINPGWGTINSIVTNDYYFMVTATPDTLWISAESGNNTGIFMLKNAACGDPGLRVTTGSDEFVTNGVGFMPDPTSEIEVSYFPQDTGNDTITVNVAVEMTLSGGVLRDNSVVCIGINPVTPGVYQVNADGSGDFATIQAGLDAVPAGSEIVLAGGTYSGPGNRGLDFQGKDIVLRSESDDFLQCIINGGGTHPGAVFHSGESGACLVSGIGFFNCTVGILVGGPDHTGMTSPTISNCHFVSCATGILVQGGGTNPLISDCVVEANGVGIAYSDGSPGGQVESSVIASNSGHGVWAHGTWTLSPTGTGSDLLTGCEIYANEGSGVSNSSFFGRLSLRDCNIHGNEEWGVYCSSAQDHGIQMTGCSVSNNIAGGVNGAGSTQNHLTECDVFGNLGPGVQAFANVWFQTTGCNIFDNSGHGILYGSGQNDHPELRDPYDHVVVSGSRISGNGENGVHLFGSFHHTARIENCLVSHNTGEGVHISGFNNYQAQVLMEGNTLVGNAVGTGISTDFPVILNRNIIANSNGVSVQSDSPVYLTIDCCDLFGNEGGNSPTCFPDFFNTTNNFSLNPLFCDPDSDDFQLYSISPCAPGNASGCGQIGALGVGCEALLHSCYDLQLYDPESGVNISPFVNLPITVEGVVFSEPRTYSLYGGGYLQDDSGGINFHRWDYETPIQEGDRVRISGLLWPDGNGELYVGDFSWTVLETGIEPVPTEYTVTELLSDFHHIGSFVKVPGRVLNATPDSFWLDDGVSQIEVVRTDYTGCSFAEVLNGEHRIVQGPCFNIMGEMKLSPRRQDDLTIDPLSRSEENQFPVAYTLHPCSPNPFNPMTTIRYDLPRDSRVDLAIYDLTGKLVKTLRAGVPESAGRHDAVWRGRDQTGRAVAAGVYLYRLRSEGFSASRQMVLVK